MKTTLHRVLPRLWAEFGFFNLLLVPLSGVFWLLTALRRAAYRAGLKRSTRLPVPVIVVGNISVGGSGKTPLVIALCEQLRAAGWSVGVISRGYGGAARVPTPVSAESAPHAVGDEPVLIARRTGCPVWVGRSRVAAGRALLAAHPEVNMIVADDGLQHLALARDVELVVMEARGLGNGWLMPAGPLREPMRRLRDIDALIVNGRLPDKNRDMAGQVPRFAMQLRGAVFYALGAPERTRSASDFAGLRMHALAGIGHPDRFFDTLRSIGLHCVCHAFPDHHAFSAADLAFVEADALLMTEKDAVKCAAFADARMWVLRVDAHLEPDLMPLVLELLNGRKTAGRARLPGVQGPAGF